MSKSLSLWEGELNICMLLRSGGRVLFFKLLTREGSNDNGHLSPGQVSIKYFCVIYDY